MLRPPLHWLSGYPVLNPSVRVACLSLCNSPSGNDDFRPGDEVEHGEGILSMVKAYMYKPTYDGMGQNQSGGPYSSTGTQSPWESAHGEPQAATKEPPTPAPGQEAKDLQSSTSTDTEEHGETVRDASHTPQLGDSDPDTLPERGVEEGLATGAVNGADAESYSDIAQDEPDGGIMADEEISADVVSKGGHNEAHVRFTEPYAGEVPRPKWSTTSSVPPSPSDERPIPKPRTKSFDLPRLQDELSTVAPKWMILGSKFRMKTEELLQVQEKCRGQSPQHHLAEMLRIWQENRPSWRMVVNALKGMDEKDLAARLQAQCDGSHVGCEGVDDGTVPQLDTPPNDKEAVAMEYTEEMLDVKLELESLEQKRGLMEDSHAVKALSVLGRQMETEDPNMMKAPLGLESEVETQDPKTLPEMESEVETLRRLVQGKERMEREFSVLKDQNVALEQQLSEYTEVIKYQPRRIRVNLGELRQQCKAWRKQTQELTVALNQKIEQNRRLRVDYAKIEQQLQQIIEESNVKQIEMLMRSCEVEQDQAAQLESKLRPLREEKDRLNNLKETLTRQLEASFTENQQLHAEMSQKDEAMTQLRREITDSIQQSERLHHEMRSVCQERDTLQEQVENLSKLRREVEMLQLHNSELEIEQGKLEEDNLRDREERYRQCEELKKDRDAIQRKHDQLMPVNGSLETAAHSLHVLNSDRTLELEFWRVSPAEVMVLDQPVINSGSWSYITEGRFRGKQVAVKHVHHNVIRTLTQQRLCREMSLMAQVRHPNIVLFMAAVVDDLTKVMIITERLDTDLRKAYREKRVGSLHQKLQIFEDVAAALNYLHCHQQPIIHRDLSAPNVLLEAMADSRWKAKLSDFGSANLACLSTTPAPGALIYAAPETYPHHPNSPSPSSGQTTKIDVYSFGILLCEVTLEQVPSYENFQALLQQVASHMRKLISDCTMLRPEKRPSMDKVIQELQTIPQKSLYVNLPLL